MRPAPTENGNGLDCRVVQRLERVADNVRSFEFVMGFRQDPSAVERDIAVADNRGVCAAQWRRQVGEIGMAIVPADELGRSDHARQFFAGNAKLAVVRSADGQNYRIV